MFWTACSIATELCSSERARDGRALLWLHALVLWLEHEPVLDEESQEQIRAALKRLKIT